MSLRPPSKRTAYRCAVAANPACENNNTDSVASYIDSSHRRPLPITAAETYTAHSTVFATVQFNTVYLTRHTWCL
jgi:hypothetical protein